MKSSNAIRSEIAEIFRTKWERRAGEDVPDSENVKLGNDAVEIDGTVLYADMADSTGLVSNYKDFFAAEVYKSYLKGACEIINNNGGVITAFDGDRVMAVFIGKDKNQSSTKSALQINYLCREIINPAIQKQYENTAFRLEQAVGIDTGKLFVAKTGIRGANDLVWVGRAANNAAKLCSLREGYYSSFITQQVFNMLPNSSKYGGKDNKLMWDKVIWPELGIPVFRSSWQSGF